ncbi:MAG: SufE family protein [Pseudomonadota bacterium]
MQPIDAILGELEQEFALFDGWEDRYGYIIELGRGLEPLPDAARIEKNKVTGCMSQVWLITECDKDHNLHIIADSDAFIVRGLIAILLRLYNDRPARQLLSFDAGSALASLGLDRHLSPNRRSGFVAMVERIKICAAACA